MNRVISIALRGDEPTSSSSSSSSSSRSALPAAVMLLICCCCCCLLLISASTAVGDDVFVVNRTEREFRVDPENNNLIPVIEEEELRLLLLNTDDKKAAMDSSSSFSEENPPFIPVCCQTGYYFKRNVCIKSDNATLAPEFPQIYTSDLQPSKKTPDDFPIVYQYLCAADSFGIYPGEDNFYLLENGTIFTENLTSPNLITQIDYCITVHMDEDNNTVTVIAVCLPPDSSIPILYSIFNLMSAMFLMGTFFIYTAIPDLQNIHGIIVRAYVSVLTVAYFALAVVQLGDQYVLDRLPICRALAYIVHFSFLASFFWLNVMCFDIWWTFGGFRSLHGSVKQRERKKFIMYSIYAWGCASTLTSVCMIMDLVPGIPAHIIRPEFGRGSCWFNSNKARAIYFYGPMGVTVICNICLFILTAHKILKHKKDTARQLKGSDSKRHDDNKQWFNLYLKLFIVMGINWSMEIISWLLEDKLPKSVWYITDLTNTLQGVIIFIIFVWKDKIKRLLMKRFGCQGNNFLSRNSTSRSGCPTSSTSRTTCVTSAPLQEKINPYADSYRGKVTVTDESDCI